MRFQSLIFQFTRLWGLLLYHGAGRLIIFHSSPSALPFFFLVVAQPQLWRVYLFGGLLIRVLYNRGGLSLAIFLIIPSLLFIRDWRRGLLLLYHLLLYPRRSLVSQKNLSFERGYHFEKGMLDEGGLY